MNTLEVGSKHKTKQYGDLVILRYGNFNDILVEFINTGYKTVTVSSHVHAGEVKDRRAATVCGVGFLGEGTHIPSVQGRAMQVYVRWSGMLARCYMQQGAGDSTEPSFVCESWKNFQNYADWFYENYKTGHRIRRDSQLYSPATCYFAPIERSKK